MKKIAILITDDISAFHLSVPLAIFADIIPDHSLFNVVLCSVQGKTIKTSHGMHITPEYDLSVLRTADMVTDERIVGKVEMKGRAKHFEIMYRRKGFGTVVVWYKEEKGVTLVEKFKEERY